MPLKIAGFEDPFSLYLAYMDAPRPKRCKGKLKGKGRQCSFLAQGDHTYCAKHHEQYTGTSYEQPLFVFASSGYVYVLDGDHRVELGIAILSLRLGERVPDGHHIRRLVQGSYHPDDLQVVSKEQFPLDKKAAPVSIRLSEPARAYIDRIAAETFNTRTRVVEHFLMEGIAKGDPPAGFGTLLEQLHRKKASSG